MSRANFQLVLLTIQMEYVERPDLQLTMAQAADLWMLPIEICSAAVASLVATGFLVEGSDGGYVRRGTAPVQVEYVDPLTWVVGRVCGPHARALDLP